MKQIPGIKNYLATVDGRIYSKTSNRFLTGANIHGYNNVLLYDESFPETKNGRRKMFRTHRLIAKTFLENPNNLPIVCHKDGDSSNNNINNLYWGTNSDNAQDALRHGTAYCAKSGGEENGQSKLKNEDVIFIRGNNKLKNSELADMFNVSRGLITMIKQRKIWKSL